MVVVLWAVPTGIRKYSCVSGGILAKKGLTMVRARTANVGKKTKNNK